MHENLLGLYSVELHRLATRSNEYVGPEPRNNFRDCGAAIAPGQAGSSDLPGTGEIGVRAH
jgi:hypothetical protein